MLFAAFLGVAGVDFIDFGGWGKVEDSQGGLSALGPTSRCARLVQAGPPGPDRSELY